MTKLGKCLLEANILSELKKIDVTTTAEMNRKILV